jgi:adenine phosphoribosyltransferase
MTHYTIHIAGLTRSLPLFPVGDIQIAGFVIFGDVEMTRAAAEALLAKAPDFDCLLTSEAKSIPLVYEMSRISEKNYFVARKGLKAYMRDVVSCPVKSITTANLQMLYMDGSDAAAMKGKRILLVDDVISMGSTLQALNELAAAIGGTVCGQMAILAEGDAAKRGDIIFLAPLPLFDKEGNML